MKGEKVRQTSMATPRRRGPQPAAGPNRILSPFTFHSSLVTPFIPRLPHLPLQIRQLLLHRRGDSGLWALPAGALDVGETLAQTVIREAREETGLVVEPLHVLSAHGGYEINYPNGDRLCPVGCLFECQVSGGELCPDGTESLEARFITPAELPALAPHIIPRMMPRIQTAFAAHQSR